MEKKLYLVDNFHDGNLYYNPKNLKLSENFIKSTTCEGLKKIDIETYKYILIEEKPIDFKSVPICLEAENEKDVQTLKQLAHSISNAVYEINSEQRKALHVAAVFVNNFVNHLYQVGNEICDANAIPFAILKPLIQETANKIATLSPKNAQTGPAKRNDLKTIAAHEEFLKNENQAAIYKLLTQSLQNNGKKL